MPSKRSDEAAEIISALRILRKHGITNIGLDVSEGVLLYQLLRRGPGLNVGPDGAINFMVADLCIKWPWGR